MNSFTPLLAMTGATCGNVGYLTYKSCANQSVLGFTVNKNKIDPKFLFYCLWGKRSVILENQKGGAQAGINGQDCKEILIPNISLQQQKENVIFLDKKISWIDSKIQLLGGKIK
jgi:type I restriction enzyme S subunit